MGRVGGVFQVNCPRVASRLKKRLGRKRVFPGINKGGGENV